MPNLRQFPLQLPLPTKWVNLTTNQIVNSPAAPTTRCLDARNLDSLRTKSDYRYEYLKMFKKKPNVHGEAEMLQRLGLTT